MAPRIFSDELFAKMSAVEGYMSSHLLHPDRALENALRNNAAAQLDAIDVAPTEGKLLYLLAKMNGARRILEVGTLGGYSAIWLARALPAGSAASEDKVKAKVVSLEVEEAHAVVARRNIADAGLAHLVDVRVGPALETLAEMAGEGWGGQGGEVFDMVFIDADKENNVGYLEWALKFSRQGTVIVVDNVVRRGRIVDEGTTDVAVQGVRRAFEMMGKDKRIDCTAVQTVGSKGWDGFAIALVL